MAKVYHYDLFGKREDKYKFLFDNNLNNIEWKELKFEAPFFLFIPQNEIIKSEYDRGISVKDMFRISGVGITTAHNDFVIDADKEKLLQKFNDFKNSYPNADELHKKFNVAKKDGWDILKGWKNIQEDNDLNKYIQKIAYRPFDTRYIFYEDKLVWRCVRDIMEHFVNNADNNVAVAHCVNNSEKSMQGVTTPCYENSNIALNVARQSKIVGSWQYCFITNGLVDLSFMGGGNTGAGYIFPLYIYDTENVRKILREENEEVGGMFEDIKHFENKVRIENFTPKFRKFINEKYGEIKPEEILGYIYAILFHKEYRKKYLDFLKIDFPKIPFVKSKEDFLKFAKLGEELYNLHLGNLKIQKEVGEPMFKDNKNKNEKIVKAIYNENEKDLFVNESLYFKNVDKEVWEYKIGGYQVLDKYLKSHKNENIDYEHFENMIKILTRSIEIEAEISELDF